MINPGGKYTAQSKTKTGTSLNSPQAGLRAACAASLIIVDLPNNVATEEKIHKVTNQCPCHAGPPAPSGQHCLLKYPPLPFLHPGKALGRRKIQENVTKLQQSYKT